MPNYFGKNELKSPIVFATLDPSVCVSLHYLWHRFLIVFEVVADLRVNSTTP